MADFWRVMARLLLGSAPTEDDQETIPDELWTAHTHGTGRHQLKELISPTAAKWMPQSVKKGTAAWNELNPAAPAHDINEAKNNMLIQSQAEASSALERSRLEAKLRIKQNPRANPEDF